MTPTVVPALANLRNHLGEGALWHARTHRLYWVDRACHTAHAYEPATGRSFTALVGEPACAIVPTRRSEVLVAFQQRFAFLDFAHARLTPFPVDPLLPPDHRFTNGKCDSLGHLWIGSMALAAIPGEGALWCLRPALQAERRRGHLTSPEGLAWSRDGRTLYHLDTPTRCVEAFTVDPVDGALSAPRRLREFAPGEGTPHGIATDAEGCLWIALCDGWRVVRLDPATGATRDALPLPVQRPTSCAFGGPNLETLYITTASADLSAAERAAQPLAGALFEATLGITGIPGDEFAG